MPTVGSRKVARIHSGAALAVLLGVAVLACSRTGSSAGTRPTHYTGRLLQDVVMALPDGYAAGLDPDERAALEADTGGHVDDAQNALVFDRAPYPGRYVKVGADLAVTDSEGYFRIPDVSAAASKIDVYRQTNGSAPEKSFPLNPAGFDVASDESAPVYVVVLLLPLPGDMNALPGGAQLHHLHGAPHSSGSAAVAECIVGADGKLPDGCDSRCNADDPDVVTDAKGCCQDYDAPPPRGDRCPRNRKDSDLLCKAKAYNNFVNSLCFQWSNNGQRGKACANESAYQCLLSSAPECKGQGAGCSRDRPCLTEGTDCIAGHCAFPTCYQNHKYRNCQNLRPQALTVNPTNITAPPGGSVDISLENATEANETWISGLNGSNGTVVLTTPGPSLPGGSTIEHFNDNLKKHYSQVKLRYTAPPKSQCKGIVPVVLLFTANQPSAPKAPVATLVIFIASGNTTSLSNTETVPAAADACPVDPAPSGPLSDILVLASFVNGWDIADQVAPGPAELSGAMSTGPTTDLVHDVGKGGIDTTGNFGFRADCTGGGGACAHSIQVATKLCNGPAFSDPKLRLVSIDAWQVPEIYTEPHIRAYGELFLARQPYPNAISARSGDTYTYVWADRNATVSGSCAGGGRVFDLDLRRGWNSVHLGPTATRTEPIPADAKWYYIPVAPFGP